MYSKMLAAVIIFTSCSGTGGQPLPGKVAPAFAHTGIADDITHISSIPLPDGYTRIPGTERSFTAWLRNLALKKDKTVYLYDGSEKANQSAQFAVLDISVGNKNLQQCADAVMRLRAEYLFSAGRYSSISFTDNEGGVYKFNEPYTKDHLLKYLERVFGMCGSASLSRQLKTIQMKNMQPGDVLIKGGFPGHAVIVMDMAQNDKGQKLYLLAQSYMPAQDIHILKNPNNEHFSPWYQLNDDRDIITPEYYFTNEQLKRW